MPTALPLSPAARRAVAAVGALILLTAAVAVALDAGTGWWQLGIFLIATDVALLAGAGRGLERGQLHPRAVALYNALHRPIGPALLAVAALTGVLGVGYLV